MKSKPSRCVGIKAQRQDRKSAAVSRLPARSLGSGADGDREMAEPGRSDAPPSNTASDNCNVPFFKPLRWGVDSLYLSYAGELFPDTLDRLKSLKTLAQSGDPRQQAQAQYPIGEHLFEVRDKGAPVYPYILEDGAFRIQLSNPSKTIPMAYVKVSSGYLTHMGPEAAEASLRALLAELGALHDEPKVSRIDLFVDFVSSVEMESWDRHAWVTRAATVNAYSVNGRFTGWAIGLGGILAARLYDKLFEIETSGKTYLLDLWQQAGRLPGEPVWRLETQWQREALTQRGLSRFRDVLAHRNGLWSYATTEWTRLTLPNPDDQTRSRWPVHPLWACLASIDWETDGGPLSAHYTPARIPGDDKLFSLGFSLLVSYMAREGIADLYAGQEAFITALYSYHEGKAHFLGQPFDDYIAERVAVKARQFNTIRNNPNQEAERKAAELARQAVAYRKASDGA